jgi:hypothetical protein
LATRRRVALAALCKVFLWSTTIRPLSIMRRLLSFLLLGLLSLTQALSSSGNRLLVVIEEAAEKDKYSQFWGDLEGMFEAIGSKSSDKLY